MPRKTETLRVLPLYLMAAVVPVSVSAGGVSAGLIFAAALLAVFFDSRTRRQLPSSAVLALGAFFLVYAVATALSAPYTIHWNKWLEELWLKLLLLAVPLTVGMQRHHVPRILKTAFVVASLAAVYGLWQHFSGQDLVRGRSLMTEFGHNEIVGFFGHKLSYGGQLLIFILLGAALFFRERNVRWRLLLGLGLSLQILALVWSYARSPQLGVLAGALVFFATVRGKYRPLGLASVLAPMILVASVPSLRENVARIFSFHRNVTRFNLWESSWEGIQARPVLGYGPGNFNEMMSHHEVEGFYNTRAHSHNDFLMHGVNAGLLGLLAAVALLLVVTFLLWRHWKRAGDGAWIALGCVAIQVGISVAGFFQVYQTDDEVEMLLYFVLGCGLALIPGELKKPPAEKGRAQSRV